MSVRTAAAAGVWSAADLALRQGVSFAVLMIMARLLRPEDFGVVALVTFFSSLSIVFVQGGLSQALIQRQHTTVAEESAVFWWNLGGSAVCAAGLVAIAPLVAAFYAQPVIAPLMLAAAAQLLFSALGAVQTALLSRQLRFDRLTIAGGIAAVASGAAGIAAAVGGLGIWALAVQLVVLAAVNSLVLWMVCDWRPVLHARFGTIRSLLGFGIYLSLSSALDVLYTQGFALIIGKLHSVRELGLYNRANSTQALPSNVLGSVIGRLAFPLFAARAHEPDALRRGVRMANGMSMLVNLPAMLGLAVLSDLVIVTLFGEQWTAAAPILAILALGGVLLPLHVINLQVLLAQAQSRRFFQLELIKKAGGLAFVAAGSWAGIEGLAWSVVLFGIVAVPINAWPVKTSLGYGAAAQLWDLRGLAVPAALMCAGLVLLRPLLAWPPPVELAVLSAAGAAIYGASGLALRAGLFTEALAIGRMLVRGERGLAA